MKQLKLLMQMEIKNRNPLIYFFTFVIIYLILAFIISGRMNHNLSGSITTLSLLLYVIFGLIFSLIMRENLKNDQTTGIIKTFSTYPVSAYSFIISKILIFTIIYISALIAGSIISSIFIFSFSQFYLYFLIMVSLFTVLSSIAIFSLVSLFSLSSIISEVLLVLYYFIIFFIAIASININTVAKFFPLFYIYPKIFGITDIPDIMTIIFFPLFYIIILIFSVIIIKITGWHIFYYIK